jgi:MerR family transcriptional regulator, heat shock protein HspR
MRSQALQTHPPNQDVRLCSIGEAAQFLGVSVPTLRLYERQGLIIPIKRPSGHRFFTAADIARVHCIRDTINARKISIAGIKHLLSLIPCWRIKNCSEDDRAVCDAFRKNEGPCWAAASKGKTCTTASCRSCTVYLDLADCDSIKRIITRYTTPLVVDSQ